MAGRGGNKKATIQARAHSLRALLQVAYDEGVLSQNRAVELGVVLSKPSPPKGPSSSTLSEYEPGRVLSQVEVRWLRSSVDLDSSRGKRDLAILDCILYLALHPDELISLQRQSLYQEKGVWWLLVPPARRSKARRLQIKEEPLTSLHLWLQVAVLQDSNAMLPLFVSINKSGHIGERPIRSLTVERVVADYGSQVHLTPLEGPGQLTPTILRRTCARTAYDHGATLMQIQGLLGYANLESAARFIGLTLKEEEAAVHLVWY